MKSETLATCPVSPEKEARSSWALDHAFDVAMEREKSFGFLLVEVVQLTCQQQLRLQLRRGAPSNVKESQVLGCATSPMPLCDVADHRASSLAQLGSEAVALLRRKRSSDPIQMETELERFLPDDKIFEGPDPRFFHRRSPLPALEPLPLTPRAASP